MNGNIYHMSAGYMDNVLKEVGESEAYLDFQQKLSKVAKVDRPVLLIGERGTGKEISAKRIHYLSSRWEGPLVTVNLAALPPTLIESELFGYEKGAFTGANSTHKGRFEEAEGGTLFLDEIGLMPLEVQEKILRVVEYGTYQRVGSSVTHEADVRIVGATNADLPRLCEEGKFKEDLLDRLSFEVLFLPPLRVREDDIMLLASYFASRMSFECQKDGIPEFTEDVERKLMEYSWPGNVRELKNVIERAVYRTDGNVISEIELDPFRNPYERKEEPVEEEKKEEENPVLKTFSYDLKSLEKAHEELDITFISRALTEGGGSQKAASELLGLTYDQFRGLYRKYRNRLKG